MASCESQIWGLVGEIEPTQAQKDAASRSHNYLRDILLTGNFANRITGHYLSGSYARDTAIRPIDDVDIIFVINPAAWPGATTLLMGNPTPHTVLESFASAIRYRYPVSSVFGQRRSVRLELYHLDIDVVPAISTDFIGEVILIPDRESGNWIKSSPKRHATKAIQINAAQSGKFKPLVKVLKFWNGNLPSTANFKSFAIETMAARIFTDVAINSLEEGLLIFFDIVAKLGGHSPHFRWNNSFGMSLDWLNCNVPDLAGTGVNIVAKLDGDRRGKFVEAARISRDRMLEAKNSLTTEVALKRVRDALRV